VIGSTIQHYRITAKLGQGGMGEVYRATDVRLGRSIALKLMSTPAADSAPAETWERLVREAANEKAPSSDSAGRSRAGDARMRFLREARTVSALNHPGIVVIYDVGEWEGRLFIAMELVEGATLREKLKQGSLDAKVVVKMGITLAEALVRAHHAGVIHRDIKPENIIIAHDGQAKLLDFGIAKLRHPDAPGPSSEAEAGATLDHSLTTPGFILGTVHYMSPEQTRQQEVDPRSDLFSVGAVLYECLSGRKAFDGPMVDAMYHIAHNHPPAIRQSAPAVPEDLERIVEKLMEKDREERYQNAGDLLVDLRRAERRMIAGTSGCDRRNKQRNDASALAARGWNRARVWRHAYVWRHTRGSHARALGHCRNACSSRRSRHRRRTHRRARGATCDAKSPNPVVSRNAFAPRNQPAIPLTGRQADHFHCRRRPGLRCAHLQWRRHATDAFERRKVLSALLRRRIAHCLRATGFHVQLVGSARAWRRSNARAFHGGVWRSVSRWVPFSLHAPRRRQRRLDLRALRWRCARQQSSQARRCRSRSQPLSRLDARQPPGRLHGSLSATTPAAPTGRFRQ